VRRRATSSKWWASYVTSCAIQVHYTGDCSQCEATLPDAWVHAVGVFEGRHGKYGTVGRYVPFDVPNCPATIDIVATKDVDTKDIDVLT
jgi:hypothetical protein